MSDKPPYRSYKKSQKQQHHNLPQTIDTPQAQQFVDDFYRILEFLRQHIFAVAAVLVLLVAVGGFFTLKAYMRNSKEKAAALLFDKGIYYLQAGNKTQALKFFKESFKKYKGAPSADASAFLYSELTNETEVLKAISKRNFLVYPEGKVQKALVLGFKEGKLYESLSLLSSLKRSKDWNYPQALYYVVLAELKKGDMDAASSAFDILKGDYQNSLYTKLAWKLMKEKVVKGKKK